MALVPVAACAVLLGVSLGLGYLLNGGLTGASGDQARVPLVGPPQLVSANSASQASSPSPRGTRSRPTASNESTFLVTNTDTTYRKSTLRIQVRTRLAAETVVPGQQPSATDSSPTTAVSGTAGSQPVAIASTPGQGETPQVAPSKSLVACVLHLTRHVTPTFVDRATYQAVPVYVIAVSNEAWVVGIDCTAARPGVIASVTLGSTA